MGIVAWIIFGALVGWIASLLTGQAERRGCLANILIGMVGSLIGGLLAWAIMGATPEGFTFQHTIWALLGALILLTVNGWWETRGGSTA